MGLEGNLVYLREEKEEDLDKQKNLRNDLTTQGWSRTLPPDYTSPMYKDRFLKRKFSLDRNDGRFTIISKETEEYIGHISYSEYEDRLSATIGVAIDKKFWGKGMAYDAQEVLLKFLFLELGCQVIRIWTESGKKQAVGLAKRSGFKISGKLRNTIYKGGIINNTLIIDLLREEYFTLHPELTDKLPPLV
ncbi:MAG: GNAT family N-acetyltransferase [Candidatus Heimdallarchaeota archaeon]|nr:GNAT family N-acetyltransferase [Candidatus Heimdallarchaeota archaeon]